MDDATQGANRTSPVDKFIDLIEVTAAGFLAVVTLLTFVSVILRYFFSWAIPDSYDFTSLLLGILIFWGMAVASYRGDHITVDLVWGAMPPLVPSARWTCSRRWSRSSAWPLSPGCSPRR